MGAELIYTEYKSGVKANRPEYKKLLNAIKEGDIVIATEISRLTRSTTQLYELLRLIEARRAKLIIPSLPPLDYTASSDDTSKTLAKLMLTLAGSFAEMERQLTVERIKSGLEAAKRSGKKLGRVRVTAKNIPEEKLRCIKKHYPLYLADELSLSAFARLCGVTRATLYKYIDLLVEAGVLQEKNREELN
jgi:DNA invertase Pin-like site-specific DNA recombinase